MSYRRNYKKNVIKISQIRRDFLDIQGIYRSTEQFVLENNIDV